MHRSFLQNFNCDCNVISFCLSYCEHYITNQQGCSGVSLTPGDLDHTVKFMFLLKDISLGFYLYQRSSICIAIVNNMCFMLVSVLRNQNSSAYIYLSILCNKTNRITFLHSFTNCNCTLTSCQLFLNIVNDATTDFVFTKCTI